MKKGVGVALAAVFLVLSLSSVFAYEEGIHFIRPEDGYILTDYSFPEFLSVEDITFIACTEDDLPLKSSLLCLDNNNFVDLDTYKWTDDENCYLSSFNLKGIPCKNLIIQSEYTKDDENYRISKKVRVNKLTKVLDHVLGNQYNDGGWRESISTAYGIWALSYYDEIFDFEIESGMRWLKLNRNDDEKCWPKSPCEMERSANILALLSLANYTDYYRVLNDGENLMEELQNYYIQGNTWKTEVFPLVPYTTLSLVSYDQEILGENFTLANNSWTEFSFQAYTDRELLVISDENVKARIINQEGDILVNYQGDNMSYTTPGACWSSNKKGEPCDLRVSLYNTLLKLPDDNIEQAKLWLETVVENSTLVGSYVGDEEDPIDTALFLYLMEESHASEEWLPKIVNWVTYNQNNEGSWGEGNVSEKAVPTALSSLALLKYGYNRSSEQVEDAEEWASENEEDADLNDTITQSALFSILRNNARPLVTSSPLILQIRNTVTEVDLFNPTTFDLKEVDYEFSDNLADILSIEKKSEISAYSYRKLMVTKIGEQTQNTYGHLKITNLGREIGRIPIIVSDFPTLNVSVTESLFVFGTSAKLSLQATKSNHEFICEMSWNSADIKTPGSFKISGPSVEFQIAFDRPATKEEVYKGTLSCKQGEKVFEFPVSTFITRYSSEPLDVGAIDSLVNSTSDNMVVSLRNNLDQDLTVSISFDQLSDMFDFESQVTLNPNENRNITFYNRIPGQINVSGSPTITFSALDRQKTVIADVNVIHIPEKDLDLIKLIVILAFISIVISVGAFFAYKKREEIVRMFNRLNIVKLKEEVKEEEKEIGEMKTEERDMIITNLFRIMRFQNKDDKEIKESLLKNFTRKQIADALEKSGNSLQGLEEEEPEEI
jgi:hypothetical protein